MKKEVFSLNRLDTDEALPYPQKTCHSINNKREKSFLYLPNKSYR
jgi:hypothetical protein